MTTTYSVSLPVKAYVKKYITALEGDPIHFHGKSMLCMILRPHLSRHLKCGLNQRKVKTHLLTRKSSLQIIIPIKQMGSIGHSISPESVVLINRILEDCFDKALLLFVDHHTRSEGRFRGLKEAYQAFATFYNIELEKDISYDGLKKIHYRGQKKADKNFLTFVPSTETPQQQAFHAFMFPAMAPTG